MPDVTSALLWDLRTQCEAMLRTLSQAQRRLEEYGQSLPEAFTCLGDEVARLRVDAAAISMSVQQVDTHLRDLPTVNPPRAEQASDDSPNT